MRRCSFRGSARTSGPARADRTCCRFCSSAKSGAGQTGEIRNSGRETRPLGPLPRPAALEPGNVPAAFPDCDTNRSDGRSVCARHRWRSGPLIPAIAAMTAGADHTVTTVNSAFAVSPDAASRTPLSEFHVRGRQRGGRHASRTDARTRQCLRSWSAGPAGLPAWKTGSRFCILGQNATADHE